MKAIGFYVFPGFQMLDFAGPAGAFEAANDQFESPAYRVHVLAADEGVVTNSLGMATTAASLGDAVVDTLVVTGGRIDPLLSALSAGTLRRIVEASSRCRRVASVCTGAFALARSESTRLNSSHLVISYAVFCLKKKKRNATRVVGFHARTILLCSTSDNFMSRIL